MQPKCTCPHCGTKHESKDLYFDFTGFVMAQLKEILFKDSQNKEAFLECETLFNKHRFYYTEEDLWILPEAKEEASASSLNKKVIYSLPWGEINKKAVEEKMNDFVVELQKNKEKVSEKKYTLWLLKGGSNDIEDKVRVCEVRNVDTGKTIADVRLCPECHKPMSYWAGRYEEICLTVLGGPRVSKSTTLTACMSAFRKAEGNVYWEGAEEDEAWQFFKRNYLEPYENGQKVMPTETQEAKIPKVSFRVTVNGKKIILTFVDLSGEFNGQNGLDDKIYKDRTPFYDNVDFVWYCTDPAEVMQLEGTAQDNKELEKLGYGADLEIIPTDKLVYNMRHLSGLFARANRKVPVIYILGKSDTDIITTADKEKYELYSSIEPDLYEPLEVEPFFEQAGKVREYMKKYNPKLVKAFEEYFPDRCYTAISAYGYTPGGEEEKESKPYHCKLPFYWMLALKNYIDVKITVTTYHFGRKKREDMVDQLENLPEDVREKAEHNLCMHGSYRL